jgi:hypothetical protein
MAYFFLGALWRREMREYYYLNGLRESPYELTPSEAIHLGSSGKLKFYVFMDTLTTLESLDAIDLVTQRNFFIGVPAGLLRTFEKAGSLNQLCFDAIAELKDYSLRMDSGVLTEKCRSKMANRLASNGNIIVPQAVMLYCAEEGKVPPNAQKFAKLRREHPRPKITAYQLLVWAEDLEKLADNRLITRLTEDAKGSDLFDTERQEHPPHLEALTLAWRKYWKNADRHDRSTHPKKDTVKNWLIEQGLSDKTADAGATIITPDWKK